MFLSQETVGLQVSERWPRVEIFNAAGVVIKFRRKGDEIAST